MTIGLSVMQQIKYIKKYMRKFSFFSLQYIPILKFLSIYDFLCFATYGCSHPCFNLWRGIIFTCLNPDGSTRFHFRRRSWQLSEWAQSWGQVSGDTLWKLLHLQHTSAADDQLIPKTKFILKKNHETFIWFSGVFGDNT